MTVCGLFPKEAGDYSSEALYKPTTRSDWDEGEVCIVEFQSLHAALNLKE